MSNAPSESPAAAVALVHDARLRPMRILRDAIAIYRRHWWGLMLGALAVFLPLAALDAVLDQAHGSTSVLVALLHLGETVIHVFGDVFYAGLVAAAVIAWRRSSRIRPLQVVRTMPWGTIIALDLLLPLAVALGLVLLIVPGVLVFVYFGLAPAFAKIEHLRMRPALRRSYEAVRGSFWRVLAVYVVVVISAGIIQELLQELADAYIGSFAVHLAVRLAFAPFGGLAMVLTAYALGAREESHDGG
ncbi:MAG: hypothetical protein IRZ32_15345 [Solirubrobacteraceae bacterium]|nr:hypothetical protein [Solirubrobacteraceae bacterium]